jgi:hypothetical protein
VIEESTPERRELKRQADALEAIAKSLGAMLLVLQSLQTDVRQLVAQEKNKGAQ